MKTLVTTLACAGMLMAGAAFAQSTTGSSTPSANPPPSTAETQNDMNSTNTTEHGNTMEHAKTAKTVSHETKAERIATREMCHKAADDKGLTGTARTDFMRSCHLEVVPR
jgi:poly(3-hydroxybutyrate) depolymerase